MSQVIKRCVDPISGDPAPGAAIACFRSLQRLQELSVRGQIVAGPRPLALNPEVGVVVMEYIPGPTLETVFRRTPIKLASCVAEQAGCWLAELQLAGETLQKHVEVERVLDFVRKLSHASSVTQKVLSVLSRSAPAIAHDPVPFVTIYGDFKPSNLIWGQSRIFGLDPGLEYQGPFVHDAAYFLNHVALLKSVRNLSMLGDRNRKLQSAFMNGYRFRAQRELGGCHLTWLRLANAARLAAWYGEWATPLRWQIHRWQIGNLVHMLNAQLEHELTSAPASMSVHHP